MIRPQMKYGYILISFYLCQPSIAGNTISIGGIHQSGEHNQITIGGAGGHNSRFIEGSGKRVSITRPLKTFSEIASNISVDIDYQAAPRYEVMLAGDDNILTLVSTEVDGPLLTIDSKASFTTTNTISITVFAPFLSRLAAKGSGDIQLHSLKTRTLELVLSGSGNLQASGNVAELKVKLRGSGDLNLQGLKAKKSSIVLKGSGDVSIYASNDFHGRITGSGDVRVFGKPAKVTKRVTGSGEFIFE